MRFSRAQFETMAQKAIDDGMTARDVLKRHGCKPEDQDFPWLEGRLTTEMKEQRANAA